MKASPPMVELYLDCERYDGYWRDRCVFHPRVDIMDSMHLVVRYDSGALLSYSLNAFSPYEGFRYSFNGTRGRLEYESLGVPPARPRGKHPLAPGLPAGLNLRLYPHFKPARALPVSAASGGYGGGDARLMADLFARRRARDPYGRAADFAAGAMSILIGVAANRSMQTGRPVRIADLVKRLPRPRQTPITKG